MTGGTGMGRVTLASAAAMVVLMIAATGMAAVKPPPPTPVTATIQAKPHSQVYCEECIRFSGRVSSPKAVCRANRTLENATAYKAGSPAAGKVYRDPHFVETDGQGRWNVVVGSGEPLAWLEVTVPKIRVGTVTCLAARAKVTL
jgi:hypothetical protein